MTSLNRKRLRAILHRFASNFANFDDPQLSHWWGKDTDLGKCEEEFEETINEIIKLSKED